MRAIHLQAFRIILHAKFLVKIQEEGQRGMYV